MLRRLFLTSANADRKYEIQKILRILFSGKNKQKNTVVKAVAFITVFHHANATTTAKIYAHTLN